MVVQYAGVRGLEVELRQQAHYWQAQHACATQREAAWKAKARQLEQVVRRQPDQITVLTQKLEEALARVAWLEGQVFGRKSEQCPQPVPCPRGSTPAVADDAEASDESDGRRKRGKQLGAKGYGRKRRANRPAEDVVHDLPADQRRCPRCGKPFDVFPGTEAHFPHIRSKHSVNPCGVRFIGGAELLVGLNTHR